MKRLHYILILTGILAGFFFSFISGGIVIKYYSNTVWTIYKKIFVWDDAPDHSWPDSYKIVSIQSTADAQNQKAYFRKAHASLKPLLVSLHAWSGDFRQDDPLADIAMQYDWNYIHPDFRGPNWTKDACLSKKVISDIDDAIQYAIDNGTVDLENIFIVGESGGGYATLGAFLRTKHKIKAFLAWVPISDLVAWFYESENRDSKYANDILNCTSSSKNATPDIKEAKKRSPIFWDIPEYSNGRLEIFAGIKDGYTGSVPVSHSILFFNRLARHYGYSKSEVEASDIIKLVTRGVSRGSASEKIGSRGVLYSKNIPQASLTIFDGSHEMLPEYCFKRLQEIAEQGAVPDDFSAVLQSR
ncbi:hypothetical protein MNBD_GAMMA10-1530 [hydrothermal vent metagenome]|uniref:Peptidase S9 prolyl oligopeptidase catalytic domain-containing protein n=1 Tax=hydrothermal vent metagenome TaxID=652676 RepID=A0A3B0XP58_9ZZZZ